MKDYLSWGHYPRLRSRRVQPIFWQFEMPNLTHFDSTVLPFAHGRSYGDSCLNEGGTLLDVSPLRKIVHFDRHEGILRCEAGVTLGEILDLIVPRGWFLPVLPGTQHVSVGGAIANDIHGKNHHKAGSFGCHVTQFELFRSTGELMVCSETENKELFQATIGGLGLTGIILWAELRLKSVTGPEIVTELFSQMENLRAVH